MVAALPRLGDEAGIAALSPDRTSASTGAEPRSVGDLLWSDVALYERKREKAASALAAVTRALDRNRPLDGGETSFLRLERFLADASADAFRAVWLDPTAYHFARVAYDLVGACVSGAGVSSAAAAVLSELGSDDVQGGLARHLADFAPFAIAAALLDGRDLDLSEPWAASSPASLPGTRLVLEGGSPGSPLLVHAVRGGELETSLNGARYLLAAEAPRPSNHGGRPPRLATCAVASHAGYSALLKPEVFLRAGVELAGAIAEVPPGYQAEQAHLVVAALERMERFAPESFRQFRALVRVIALKPIQPGAATNVSHSDLPGAFVLTIVPQPLLLADAMIHELHHNRLFHIEEGGAFFSEVADNLHLRGDWYSPWREELRPMHGVFHAVYVNLPVARFWAALYADGFGSPLERALIADQVVRVTLQLVLGARQVERFGGLSEFGRTLFDEMVADLERLRATVRGLGLSGATPAIQVSDAGEIAPEAAVDGIARSVRDVIAEHVRRYDVERQCGDVEVALANC